MLFLARSIFLNNKRFYKCQSITQEVAHNKAYSKKLDSINLVTAMQLAPSVPIWSLLFFISREYLHVLLPMNYLLKYYLFKMPLNYNTLKVSISNEMLEKVHKLSLW